MSNLSIRSPGPNQYSADVEQLQNNLLALGFYCSIDGYFGSETEQAVKNLQYTWGGLTIDGIVGPMTAAALDSAVNLLLEGQWNDSADPMEAPATAVMTVAPKVPTTTGASKTIQITSIVKSIDWKWIVAGIGGALLIFRGMKGKKK